MSKKNAEKEQKKVVEEEEEEEDREDEEEEEEGDEEDEEEGDEEDEEDEDEEPAAAQPVESRRARPRRQDHDDHGHDDDEEDSDEEDPYWWTPHAVMSVLVLIGVLGFFGLFNKALGFLAPKGGVPTTTATQEKKETPGASTTISPTPPAQREEFGAKHLLVQYKGAMRAAPSITRTEDEAKARATEAMKKAKGGAKFEDVVKEYSDEPGAAQRGGDLGRFRKGQMVAEFQAAVEKLKVGEISDLVKTPFGYHVILRTQ